MPLSLVSVCVCLSVFEIEASRGETVEMVTMLACVGSAFVDVGYTC